MTNITIYSHFADCPEWRIERAADGLSTDPTWTGEVDVRDLEDVFRLFNRVDEADCQRLESWGYTLPSLSVGDIVTADGNSHLVANVGFLAVDEDWVKDYKTIPVRDKFMEVYHMTSARRHT